MDMDENIPSLVGGNNFPHIAPFQNKVYKVLHGVKTANMKQS